MNRTKGQPKVAGMIFDHTTLLPWNLSKVTFTMFSDECKFKHVLLIKYYYSSIVLFAGVCGTYPLRPLDGARSPEFAV